MTAPPIEVHIERVVLTGPRLSPRDAARFRSSLGRELTRLLREQPLRPSQSAAWRTLDAPAIVTGSQPRPGALGAEVARQLHSALGGAL
jgi:hypothetical protein